MAWQLHYTEARKDATRFEIEGVKIPTASIPHLIKSKRKGWLQDAADIEALEEIERLSLHLPRCRTIPQVSHRRLPHAWITEPDRSVGADVL